MFTSAANVEELIRNFRIDGVTFRYSSFVPRLYNYVKSLGFETGKMIASRAFCADENQGYPTILLTKHFGSFPFNHGRGGAVVATNRHGPFAEHGESLVIVQASHVGYEPEDGSFGKYSRTHARDNHHTGCCGKIVHILEWYLEQYRIAQQFVLLERCDGKLCLRIDNGLLDNSRSEGLFLKMARLVRSDSEGNFTPLHTHSTSKTFVAKEALEQELIVSGSELDNALEEGQRVPIGEHLKADMFQYRRDLDERTEGRDHQEKALMYPMPWIVTSPWPALTAAQINTQVEFDRALRTVALAPEFNGKCLFYISGLNIDISPQPGELFPTTKFVPWAAFLRDRHGGQRLMEQDELIAELRKQSKHNPDEVDLDIAIRDMAEADSVQIEVPENG